MQQFEGRLVSWKKDKGFGFIRPSSGDHEIFIHIRDLRHEGYVPNIGDVIIYRLKQDSNGKTRAYDAYIKDRGSETLPKIKSSEIKIHYIGLSLVPFVLSIYSLRTTFYPFMIYSIMSIVCFIAYSSDKKRAQSDAWRISEARLHLCELAGGWPGGLIAQQKLHHKTKKLSYQLIFWLIVGAHFIAWSDYLYFESYLAVRIFEMIKNVS